MNRAYLILGSNINPEVNIPQALGFLNRSFTIRQISKTWRTRSIGMKAADFFNTAVEIETGLDESLLKDKCLCHIEEVLGRIREKNKNAPRTIDIDIVVFNNKILDPEIFTKEHLALPLSEIVPNLVSPQGNENLLNVAEQLHELGTARIVGLIKPLE